ncbi:ras-related protein RABE1c-like [Cannabis sativa]|uniref:ras-related protein RABE1c-like n=1 Tax=Cannabis sativa TaxID=3483 RepID=UPI0029CAA81B|nr:ras-related protein RABE1c-like [Cannabis sativa]
MGMKCIAKKKMSNISDVPEASGYIKIPLPSKVEACKAKTMKSSKSVKGVVSDSDFEDEVLDLDLKKDTTYYRGAKGILLVYDVIDESSFNNNLLFSCHSSVYFRAIHLVSIYIRNWIRNIEQHASDNVNKILVGNKADMDESRRDVPTAKGQALADEYGINAETNLNVEQVFFSIARDIKQRLADTDNKAEVHFESFVSAPVCGAHILIHIWGAGASSLAVQKSACCGS